jgi:methanogenic corrinoid protein MtbC1
LLRLATEAGHKISDVAKLPLDRLTELVRSDISATTSAPLSRVSSDKPASSLNVVLDLCLEAIAQLDTGKFELLLAQASRSYSQTAIVEQLITPLMNEVGDRWRDGRLRVAHEHLATAVIRNFLATIVAAYHVEETAPVLLATTPAGQLHEIGALLATATAVSAGWRVTYLGPNLPAEEIAGAAHQNKARAVALSIVYPEDDPRVDMELQKLHRLLTNGAAILVGGRAAPAYAAGIARIGATLIRNLGHLRQELERVRSQGKPLAA